MSLFSRLVQRFRSAPDPLRVERPGFVEWPAGMDSVMDRALVASMTDIEPEPQWKRNLAKTPAQRSAEAKKGHIKRKATAATKAKNKARVPVTSKGAA